MRITIIIKCQFIAKNRFTAEVTFKNRSKVKKKKKKKEAKTKKQKKGKSKPKSEIARV